MLSVSLVMGPDFEACGSEFLNDPDNKYRSFVYNGTVQSVLASANTRLITVQGCKELCGTGTAYYPYV